MPPSKVEWIRPHLRQAARNDEEEATVLGATPRRPISSALAALEEGRKHTVRRQQHLVPVQYLHIGTPIVRKKEHSPRRPLDYWCDSFARFVRSFIQAALRHG
jgi:hypothetical protein